MIRKKGRSSLLTLALAGALFVTSTAPLHAFPNAQDKTRAEGRTSAEKNIARQVRHELVMLPYYSVFDNLEYSVKGYTVTLSGQVTRPTLKTDAERRVAKIEAVEKVVNNIEVLPPSGHDDRIRIATYRAIFGQPTLQKYSLGSVPPLHIIVKNGHVTLVGVVLNEMDRNVAYIQANGVSGVFSVTNELQVENNKSG